MNILFPELSNEYPPISYILQDAFIDKERRKKLLLPNLRDDGNQTIGVFSDYSGESDGRFYTYSFLVCGWNHSFGFFDEMAELRTKHKLGKKEISFKDFRFGPISRSLDDYLRLLDHGVIGLLFSVVVDKRIATLFGAQERSTNDFICKTLDDNGFGRWRPSVAEKLLRITHIAAFLVGLLSRDGHKVLWMTDHDAISANNDRHLKSVSLFQNILNIYTRNRFELVGYVSPFHDRADMGMVDLLSAADIAAGSLAQYISGKPEAVSVKNGADKVLYWLGRDGLFLKKMTIVVRLDDEGRIRTFNFEGNVDALPEGATVVPLMV